MIKHMQINIEIDTECNTPNNVKGLIRCFIKESYSRNFSIDSVTIDGVDNYKNDVGFINDLKNKQTDSKACKVKYEKTTEPNDCEDDS